MSPKWPSIAFAILDVDDVVIDTDAAVSAAERSVVGPLAALIGGETAARVGAHFANGYDILRQQLRRPPSVVSEEYRRHRARIETWQRGVLSAGFELKLWSRDTLIALALEDAGVPVTQDLVEAAVDRYWRVMAESSVLHEDAIALVAALRARGIAIHLASNSDGFLSFDPSGGTFVYDPVRAADLKFERSQVIEKLGLSRADVTIGDPIGKPKPEFFERVLTDFEARIGAPIDRRALVAIGDSLTMDVLPLLELGAAQGGWLVRSRRGRPVAVDDQHPNVTIAGALTDFIPLLAVEG